MNKINRNSLKTQIYQIVISAILLALSVVLGLISKFIPFFRMPSGGGISLSMIPLTLTGLILGPIYGLITGLLYGTFNMLVDGALSWGILSLILDYFVAYGSAFVCGFFRKYYYKKKIWSFIAALTSFILCRIFFHTLSGILLYNPYYEELNKYFTLRAISYSLIYNLSYLIPTYIASLIFLLVLSSTLFRLNDTQILKIFSKKYNSEIKNFNIFENILLYIELLSIISLIFSFVSFGSEESAHIVLLSYIAMILAFINLVLSLIFLFKKEYIEYDNTQLIKKKFFINNHILYFHLITFSTILLVLSIFSIIIYT